ncbi:unnamed protein product [Gongylonema pulchrum]|uniref:Secreted protein n=1 Tax=Gongylonema pulchrum TaxID=637853 RepID=A0A183DCZ3_9BILA|nr:unnamed protein product [Gongylonema pulchrum]
MLSKWAGRGAALFVGYLLIHFVLIVVDNRRVIDRTQVAVGKDSDGPLIVRTAKDLSSKKNTSAYVALETFPGIFCQTLFIKNLQQHVDSHAITKNL